MKRIDNNDTFVLNVQHKSYSQKTCNILSSSQTCNGVSLWVSFKKTDHVIRRVDCPLFVFQPAAASAVITEVTRTNPLPVANSSESSSEASSQQQYLMQAAAELGLPPASSKRHHEDSADSMDAAGDAKKPRTDDVQQVAPEN